VDNLLSDTQEKLQVESETLRLLRIEHGKALKSHNEERQKSSNQIQECLQKVSKANDEAKSANN
jgi:sulfur transfer protein SufE